MTKRLLLVVVAALIVVALILVNLPLQRHFSRVEQALEQAKTDRAELYSRAIDPAQNGYLNPELLPYWGPDKVDNPVAPVMDAWVEGYASVEHDQTVDHQALQAARDPAYLQARARLEQILPSVREALARPVFAQPVDHYDADAKTINFGAVRKLALALCAHAETLLAEGQDQAASEDLLMTFELGYKLTGEKTILNQMMGVAAQQIALEGINHLLTPERDFSGSEVGRRLLESTLAEGQFRRCMGAEMLFFEEALDPGVLSQSPGLARLPFFLKRERRIYHARMESLLADIDEGRPVTPLRGDFSWGRWLMGQDGILANIMTPNYVGSTQVLDRCRRLSAGTAAAAAITGFLQRQHRLPDQLSQLDLSALEGLAWDSEAFSYEKTDNGARLTVVLPEPERQDPLPTLNYPASDYFHYVPEGYRWEWKTSSPARPTGAPPSHP
ncbi:MAG: hypothetical protein KC910_20330 [Candidatus Eremiobacteraeota bacterium]|nr:hypothetical protein [Candidatus Eremiobacteraeota bacterium]